MDIDKGLKFPKSEGFLDLRYSGPNALLLVPKEFLANEEEESHKGCHVHQEDEVRKAAHGQRASR